MDSTRDIINIMEDDYKSFIHDIGLEFHCANSLCNDSMISDSFNHFMDGDNVCEDVPGVCQVYRTAGICHPGVKGNVLVDSILPIYSETIRVDIIIVG